MKKIFLTLIAGFCIGSFSMAQDPSKVAKKKTTKTSTSPTASDAAKLKAKEAKAKAYLSGKAPASNKFSKDPGAAKAN